MLSSRKIRGYFFDTTCVNYFALTGYITLLENRYAGRAFVSKEVIDELRHGADKHPELKPLLKKNWFRVIRLEEPEDLILFNRLLKRWGQAERNRGEAATIVQTKAEFAELCQDA